MTVLTRSFSCLSLLMLVPLTSAGSITSAMHGEIGDGWGISVVIESKHVSFSQISEMGDETGETGKSFFNEPCSWERNKNQPIDGPVYTYSCADSAKSPLRGAKYVSRYVSGDCIKGNPARQEYTYISGCKTNSRQPKKLIQEYPGCANSLSASIEETQKQLPTAAAKPITSSIIHDIEKKLANSCVGSENPSDTELSMSREDRRINLASFSPGDNVSAILKWKYGIVATGQTKATITLRPKFGRLKVKKVVEADPGHDWYWSYEIYEYIPKTGFHGKDKLAFAVMVNNQEFKVTYIVDVVNDHVDYACDSQQGD